MASGIIEYLAEGAWTKRMHAGWAAQSGMRAALLARAGFSGPRTVFEGTHGLFHGFAHTTEGDYDALIGDFGTRWVTETLAFKPYPCGTMTHPYIDCARRLAARGIKPEDVKDIVCDVGEGTVHRLWEPLAAKQRPRTATRANSRTPYCIATALVRGNVGLDAFTDEAVKDPRVLAVAAKVRYRIDPHNPYPNEFTGHIRATLNDGSVVEERQPHLRGGAKEPLTRDDIEDKFALNCRHGGWDDARAEGCARARASRSIDGRIDLKELRGERRAGTVRPRRAGHRRGRNIGRAMALALAEGGAAVVVNVRSNKAEAEAVVGEIERAGGKAIVPSPTWPTRRRCARWPRTPRSSSAASTILINNAALRDETQLRRDDLDEWRAVTGVILDGAFHCARPACRRCGRAARARSSISAA